MIQYNHRSTFWLGIILSMATLAFTVGTITPGAQVLVLGLVAAMLAGSFVQIGEGASPRALIESIQQRAGESLSTSGRSSEAREALSRAESRGTSLPVGVDLLDIGLITTAHGDDGMVMRRTRSFSKDDDGVRPFLTLDVEPGAADRKAVLRFEIIDHNGNSRFVHEMETFLRDGETSLMSDHHLPLADNPQVAGMGEWDLRVYLDGEILGIHSVTLEPSSEERRRRVRRGESGSARRYVTGSDAPQSRSAAAANRLRDDEAPRRTGATSLEELLRSQSDQEERR